MLIDHVALALLWPAITLNAAEGYDSWHSVYRMLRNVGRTAFPIFAFLLVEGFFHTHNRKKYLGRLIFGALISEIPFNMAFYTVLFHNRHQNVFWTLSVGFFVIWGMEELYKRYETGWKLMKKDKKLAYAAAGGRTYSAYHAMMCLLAAILILTGWLAATILRTDYRGYGVLLIVLFYFSRHAGVSRMLTCIGGYLLFSWEPYCFGGFLLILFYNGTRKPRGKVFQYFFYLFYPIHLLILGLTRMIFWAG